MDYTDAHDEKIYKKFHRKKEKKSCHMFICKNHFNNITIPSNDIISQSKNAMASDEYMPEKN